VKILRPENYLRPQGAGPLHGGSTRRSRAHRGGVASRAITNTATSTGHALPGGMAVFAGLRLSKGARRAQGRCRRRRRLRLFPEADVTALGEITREKTGSCEPGNLEAAEHDVSAPDGAPGDTSDLRPSQSISTGQDRTGRGPEVLEPPAANIENQRQVQRPGTRLGAPHPTAGGVLLYRWLTGDSTVDGGDRPSRGGAATTINTRRADCRTGSSRSSRGCSTSCSRKVSRRELARNAERR